MDSLHKYSIEKQYVWNIPPERAEKPIYISDIRAGMLSKINSIRAPNHKQPTNEKNDQN